MTSKARIAVIGAGWWATYAHLPALQAHPGVGEIILCDIDPAKLQASAAAYQIEKTYSDVQTMLAQESLHGAVIATNHANHYQPALACLQHGLPVMVEKPFTLSAQHARHLLEVAQTQGREIIIGYPYHFTDHLRRAQQVVASGELGAIQLINSFMVSHIINLLRGEDGAEQRPSHYPVHGPGSVYSQPHLSGGGQGHLQLTHSIGLMFFVSGLRARRVHALMNRHGLPLDLVDAMTVEFEGGALGVVSGTGNQGSTGGGKQELVIHCEAGSVELNMHAGTVKILRQDQEPELIQAPEASRYPYFATAQNLVDVALGQAVNGSPAEVGWRTVELLDAAYRSAEAEGRAVFVEELYPVGT